MLQEFVNVHSPGPVSLYVSSEVSRPLVREDVLDHQILPSGPSRRCNTTLPETLSPGLLVCPEFSSPRAPGPDLEKRCVLRRNGSWETHRV